MAVNKNQMAGRRGANREDINAVQFPIQPKFNYGTGAGWKSKHRQLDYSIKRIIPGSGRTKLRIGTGGKL